MHEHARHRLGKILYEMKVHLRKHGLDKRRTGRWESILRERKIEKSTARDWVVKYQQAEGIPLEKCFFRPEMQRVKKTRNSHKYRENNRAVPALLDARARIEAADDKDTDNRDKNGRLAVECIFVLTLGEKLAFMEGVRRLGPQRATQVMYQAVLSETSGEAVGAGAS